MTAQAMDSIRFDDQDWALCEWIGPRPPTSESLGFSTAMENTANYSGRVDHFVVDNANDTWSEDAPPSPRLQLRLARIDAHLTKESADFIPPPPFGAREDITHRGWVERVTDIEAMLKGRRGPGVTKSELDTRKRVRKYVHSGTQAASSFAVRLRLTFDRGVLTGHHVETASSGSDHGAR